MNYLQIDKLTAEQTQKFFELYMDYCKQHGQQTSMKDFVLWYEERYGEA